MSFWKRFVFLFNPKAYGILEDMRYAKRITHSLREYIFIRREADKLGRSSNRGRTVFSKAVNKLADISVLISSRLP